MTRCFPSPKQLFENVPCIEMQEQVLQNLYARWAAINNLIRSLEDYQQRRPDGGGECIPFIGVTK